MSANSIKEAIAVLKAKRKDIEAQLLGLDMSIKVLESEVSYDATKSIENEQISNTTKISDANYDFAMTNKQKFVYFLDKLNRFVHFREVAELINEYEGGKYNVSDLASSLSASTASLKKKGLLVKYQEGKENRNTFWGKKGWLDAENNIKQEYFYNNK